MGLDLIGPEAIRDHGSILSEQLLQLHDGEGACQMLHMEDPAGRVSSRRWSTMLHYGMRCVCEDVCVCGGCVWRVCVCVRMCVCVKGVCGGRVYVRMCVCVEGVCVKMYKMTRSHAQDSVLL